MQSLFEVSERDCFFAFLSLFFRFFCRISFAFFAMIFLRAKKVRGTGEYEGRIGMKVKKSKKQWLTLLGMIGLLLAGCSKAKEKGPAEEIQVPEDTLLGYTYSEVYTPYQLRTCDIDVEIVQAESEEVMVTKILAGDSDYDFMMLSSESTLGKDILRTGAYCPLNDIPEVSGLLDRYHGYLKDAATAENGDIWMIPCGVDIPLLVYREELCEEYGLDFTEMTYAEFMDKVGMLPKDGEHTFSVPYYLMTGDILDKFARVYGYDNMSEQTEALLRSYMERIRAYDVPFNEGKWWVLSSENRADHRLKAELQNIVFDMERSFNVVHLGSKESYFQYGGFRAIKTPDLEEGVTCPNTAMLDFILINPKSEKLGLTLQYVAELCEKLQKDTTNVFRYMCQGEDFSDDVLRQDIYNIISEAEVRFGYPYDVIGQELWDYRSGKQEFDKMLEEIKRNLKMYHNE